MKKKIIIAVVVVLVIGGIIAGTVLSGNRNVAVVQTAKVSRADLRSIVTASGQIKPLTYTNISANAFGKIVKLYVTEGQQVKKGQLLAQLENVQSQADVASQRATLNSSQMDVAANDAAFRTAQAELKRAQAEAARTKADFERAQGLLKEKLIAQQQFDQTQAAYEVASAAFAQAQARVAQARAQKDASDARVSQARAVLTRASDQLSKTQYIAPYDGVITNLPVREGETVVVGIQNAPGSTLMTIADLSIITAEVKVDETDIVNVKLGQEADVTIDAIPNKTFKGKVTEIGNNAIIRSTGVSTSQTTGGNTEAKDFKVVVTLTEPPQNLRPGLSTTAKITTATRDKALSVPIQALTVRDEADLQEQGKDKKDVVQAAGPRKERKEVTGIFVITGSGNKRKAEFRKVETGITGSTDIEVVDGIKEGDEIVTGTYKVLRTLKPGASVKIDNKALTEEKQS